MNNSDKALYAELENDLKVLESKKEEAEKRLNAVKESLNALDTKLAGVSLDDYDFSEQYDESLDSDGTVTVCGFEYDPSRILKELDPDAYRCGLIDYVDACHSVEETEEYKEIQEEIEEQETEVECIEEDIWQLEIEIEDVETQLTDLEDSEQ